MIKELELLLPLLQQVTTDAFWLVVLVIALKVLDTIVTGALLGVVIWGVYRSVNRIIDHDHKLTEGLPRAEQMGVRRADCAISALRLWWLYDEDGNARIGTVDGSRIHALYREACKIAGREP
jgi:hypothetical protein